MKWKKSKPIIMLMKYWVMMRLSAAARLDANAMRLSVPAYQLLAGLACIGPLMSGHAQDLPSAPAIAEISVCTQEWEGDTNKDMTGLYWDAFRAVFEPKGVKLNVTYMPYKISIVRVRDKVCDIAFSGYRGEFPDLLYSRWPHELEEVVAMHAKGITFNSFRSFAGKKIAWVNEYGFELFLPADTDYVEVRSEALGMRMLERGRVEYFIDYELTIQKAAAETGFDLSGYTFSPVPKLSEMVYPMFRKDERGAMLMALYERRMAALHKDGTLDRIYQKYRNRDFPAPTDN